MKRSGSAYLTRRNNSDGAGSCGMLALVAGPGIGLELADDLPPQLASAIKLNSAAKLSATREEVICMSIGIPQVSALWGARLTFQPAPGGFQQQPGIQSGNDNGHSPGRTGQER